jgi:hypothetical protein
MLTTMLVLSCSLGPQGPSPADVRFAPPVRLKAADGWVRVESPGYAAPCWHDVDGDGDKDLVVGQFMGGKMRVHANDGDGKLAAGEWLQAEGAIAEVPGVW